MQGTPLSARATLMVVLVVVMFMGAMMATAFIIAPTERDPAGSRQAVVIALTVAALALVWFAWLAARAVSDRQRGVGRHPAKVGGWFHVCFGSIVAAGGIACSALTWHTADTTGGVWTLYWGMIAWGIIQMLLGAWKVRHPASEAEVNSGGLATRVSELR